MFADLLHKPRLRIGTRLTASFVVIVLMMMAVDLVAIWQFRRVAIQGGRLTHADQTSLAVARVHLDVYRFRDDVAQLESTHDSRRFAAEAASLRSRFREDVAQAQRLLSTLPAGTRDPAILSALETMQLTLPAQLDTSAELAATGDWPALRIRLANQVQSLVQLSSLLMEKVDADVTRQRANAIESTERAWRQLLLVLPVTALLTLILAVALGWFATRAITHPLKELDAGARALAHGEFHREIEVAGDDELAALGRALNYALRQLRELYHGIRESEGRYRRIFHGAGVSIWEEDFSQVKAAIDDLKARGISDFRRYMAAHPEFVRQAILMVKVIDVNDAAVTLFEARSKDELLGSFDNLFLPETEAMFAEELIAIAEERTSFESETVFRTLKGSRLTVLFTATSPPEPSKLDSVLVSVTDITERKRAEEALQKARAELAHVTRVTTMGELTASIAHEVNQPLAAIVTNAEAGLRWLAGRPPDLEEARECLCRIARDGNRASEVIVRVRSLAKRSAPAESRLDLNEAIQEVLAIVDPEARRQGVAVRTELDGGMPPVRGDRVQLQQVILNLVMNGIEAMKGATDRPRELRITSRPEGPGRVLVAVRDSGVGVSAESVGRVFEAFYTTKPEGMGMGLSISRSIVEAHGGELSASPNSGWGMTFRFTVPASGEGAP
jgi:PAS domain S-box-containing protein